MITENNSSDWVMLTHWDMDAAGSVIAAKQFYNILEYKAQGYGKVDKNIQILIDKYALTDTNIVIGDLSLTEEQLKLIMDNFTVVHYYDHHIDSEKLVALDDGKYHRVWYNAKMCATAMIVKENLGHKHISNEIFAMVKIIDAYDMWRTDTALFKQGKAFNVLFWQKSLFGFVKRFENGFSQLEESEKEIIIENFDNLKQNLFTVLSEQTTQYEHMLLCSLFEHQSDVINELTLAIDDIDTFFCVISRSGVISGSVRTRRDDIDVNEMLTSLEQSNDLILTAGGHKKACGVTMVASATLNDIIKVAEDFNQLLHNNTSII